MPIFTGENLEDGVYKFSVAENSQNQTRVGTVSATDDDFGEFGDIFYEIEENPFFFMESATGTIVTKQSLDREERDQLVFSAFALDGGIIKCF